MKQMNIIRTAGLALASLFAFASCDKDITEADKALPTPQVVVNDITTTSFTASWDVVSEAGSFSYIFNGGEEVTTESRSVTFTGLRPAEEYSLAVRSNAGYNAGWKDSDYVTLKIVTGSASTLKAPEPELVAAYMSRTIIKWNQVADATAYEYRVGDKSGKVTSTSVDLSGFEGSTEYVFSVKAVSDDPYTGDSEEGTLKFTTLPESEDIPQIIMSLNELGNDFIDVDIYTVADFRYLYFAIPASYFTDHSDEYVLNVYRNYVLDAIEEAGLVIESGIEKYASYGTSNYVIENVYPEMSYYVAAFGIDSRGNATTALTKMAVKTVANGGSDGPQVKGADWFTQELYYNEFGMYDAHNSLWMYWKGTGITAIKYILTSVTSYKSYFGESLDNVKDYIVNSGYDFDGDLDAVNSEAGLTRRLGLHSATSYVLAAVAFNSDDDSTFAVTSLPTKTSATFYDWVFLSLGTSDKYPAQTALAASVSISYDASESLNIGISDGKYLFMKSSELEECGTAVSELPDLVEAEGTAFSEAQIAALNMVGSISMSFGTDGTALEAGTRYTLIVSLTSSCGDKVTRRYTASTDAASTESVTGASATKSSGRPKARTELNAGRILEKYQL